MHKSKDSEDTTIKKEWNSKENSSEQWFLHEIVYTFP